MTIEHVNRVLSQYNLPSLPSLIGRKFAFTYQDEFSGVEGLLAGIIMAIHWSDADDVITVYASVPEIWGGRIHYLFPTAYGWVALLDEEHVLPKRHSLALEVQRAGYLEQAGEFKLL